MEEHNYFSLAAYTAKVFIDRPKIMHFSLTSPIRISGSFHSQSLEVYYNNFVLDKIKLQEYVYSPRSWSMLTFYINQSLPFDV